MAVLTSKLSQETREETSCKERRLSAKDLATSSFSDSRSALANSARRRPKYAPWAATRPKSKTINAYSA